MNTLQSTGSPYFSNGGYSSAMAINSTSSSLMTISNQAFSFTPKYLSAATTGIILSGSTNINSIFKEQKWDGPAGKNKSSIMNAASLSSTKPIPPAKNKSNIMNARDILSMK